MALRFPTIAIIGSGPAGCYTAQFLRKKWVGAEITIFESLPAPYGLVRYGIASDHQGSKGVTFQFERLFERDEVTFLGNVTVGRDISFTKLTDSFDVVVLATGLNHDAVLDIPVDPRATVLGAGQFLKALNGHPTVHLPTDKSGRTLKLGRHVVVIGSGNVAMDVMRLIAKPAASYSASDVSDEVMQELATHDVEKITLISRSSASQAKCDASMMAELLHLEGTSAFVEGVSGVDRGAVAELLKETSGMSEKSDDTGVEARVDLRLCYNHAPQSIGFRDGMTVLNVKANTMEVDRSLVVDTIITAVGFNNGAAHDCSVPPRAIMRDGVYKVGWYGRGANGTVAENRKDAKAVAEKICSDFDSGLLCPLRIGLESIRHELPATVVDYAAWRKIDKYELETSPVNRCRRKIRDLRKMLRVAHGVDSRTPSFWPLENVEIVDIA